MRTLRPGGVRRAPSRKISGALTPGDATPAPQGLPSYSGAALQAPTAARRVERTSHDIRSPSHPATANNAARQAQGTHVGSHISAEDGLQMHGRGRSTKPAPPFWSSEKEAVPGPSPTIPYAPYLLAGPTSTHAGRLSGGRPGPHTQDGLMIRHTSLPPQLPAVVAVVQAGARAQEPRLLRLVHPQPHELALLEHQRAVRGVRYRVPHLALGELAAEQQQ